MPPQKIWLLRPRPEFKSTLFHGWDTAQGFVVRARTELEARSLANAQKGYESEGIEAWMDSRFSSCDTIPSRGDPGVIMRDFRCG